MGISPWMTGQTDPTWQLTFTTKSDTGVLKAIDLTGYTVSLEIAPAVTPPTQPTFVVGQGTTTVLSPTAGLVDYVVSPSDFTTPGWYIIQLKATSGSAVRKSDYATVEVLKGG